MRLFFLALVIMASFFTMQAFLRNEISREDQRELAEIKSQIETIQARETATQEDPQEWRDYLEENRDLIQSLIEQITDLIHKYPHTHMQTCMEYRDYLHNLVINFEL